MKRSPAAAGRGHLLEGAKAIADYVGLELHEKNERPGADRRKRIAAWAGVGFPVFVVRGRWYAYAGEIDGWLLAQRVKTSRKLRSAA